MAIPVPNRDEAAKSIRGMNVLPRTSYKYSKKFEPIYIYNIGRWAGEGQNFFVRASGTGRSFVITLAAQPDFKHTENYAARLMEMDPSLTDEEIERIVKGVKAGLHSMPTLVEDPVIEQYPTMLGSPAKSETWEGKRIAQEIVNLWPGDDGVSAGKNPDSDLRYWGVFIAKGKVPTKEEMAEVRTWYNKRLDQLVTAGDELARDNRFREIQRIHRFALTERGMVRPWNKSAEELSEPKKSACPMCFEPIMEGAKKCKHCGEFLDGRKTPVAAKA